MKFNTFRNTMILCAVSGLFGSLYYCGKSVSSPESSTPTASDSKAPAATPTPAPAAPVPVAPPSADPSAAAPPHKDNPAGGGHPAKPGHEVFPLRPSDEDVLHLLEQRPGADKTKDATPNRPYKVNLYAEGGKYVRAKVDLDRNGKWDEKWSVEEKNGERVYKRQVSPTDDDTNYPLKFKLRHKQWEKSDQ
jgi:hypothetical protein